MIKNSVILVPFPFDDFSAIKVRPALCLTNVVSKYDHVIIAFISSKIPHNIVESDVIVEKGTSDWEGTGLAVDSVVRLHKIVTIPKSFIKRRLGSIKGSLDKKVQSKIKKLFEVK